MEIQALPAGVGPVLILASVSEELDPTLRRLNLQETPASDGQPRRWEGQVGGRRVVAALGGVGVKHVLPRLHALVAVVKPAALCHVGFAGGLHPTLVAGMAVVVRHVVAESGEAYELDQGPPRRLPARPAMDPRTSMLTLDRIADSVKVKQALLKEHGAGAVDMETYHVAAVAERLGLAMLAIRAVSDPSDMALPADAVNWVRPDGTPDMGKAMGYVMLRPWLTPTLMKLQTHAREAAKTLAEHLEQALAR